MSGKRFSGLERMTTAEFEAAVTRTTNILNKYNSYLKKEKELITIYESKYGPMTLNSPVQTNIWLWNNSPWPWEVQK